jgi:FkbM family methyltransferase
VKKIKRMLRQEFPLIYGYLVNIKKKAQINKFKKKFPGTFIVKNLNNVLYSQENQDFIVYNNFFKEKKGVFCDIGGNHPLNINNTRYFQDIGWDGYVFEPLPQMKHLWQEYRPDAKLFPFALSDTEGEVVFSIVENETGWEDMLSFIKETRDAEYKYETTDIVVQTRIFRDVCKEEGIAHIDYMSIDVEGHELNVLKGIDFDEVKINVLTIENNSEPNRVNGDDRIRRIMLENNYIFWGRIVDLDDIYVHRDFYNESNLKHNKPIWC